MVMDIVFWIICHLSYKSSMTIVFIVVYGQFVFCNSLFNTTVIVTVFSCQTQRQATRRWRCSTSLSKLSEISFLMSQILTQNWNMWKKLPQVVWCFLHVYIALSVLFVGFNKSIYHHHHVNLDLLWHCSAEAQHCFTVINYTEFY